MPFETIIDGKKYTITAGGVIIYRFNEKKKQLELLLIKGRRGYEDLGGRVEDFDKSIKHTVAREAYEESNGLIVGLRKRLTNVPSFHTCKSKYIIFLVPATKKESRLKSVDFGSMEYHDKIKRTIRWVPVKKFLDSEFIKKELCFRLRNSKLFETLRILEDELKNV